MATKAQTQALLDEARAARDAASPVLAEMPAGFQEVASGFALQNDGDVLQGTFLGFGPAKLMGSGKAKKLTPTFIVRQMDGSDATVPLSAGLIDFLLARKRGEHAIWIRREGQTRGGQGRVNQFKKGYMVLSPADVIPLDQCGTEKPAEVPEVAKQARKTKKSNAAA